MNFQGECDVGDKLHAGSNTERSESRLGASDPSPDAKLQALHTHYSETNTLTQTLVEQRGRHTAHLILLLGVLSFQVVAPGVSTSLLAEFVRARLALERTPDLALLGTVVWASLLAVLVRYCQVSVAIQRQYEYTHELENELSGHFGGSLFTREGRSYLANYPRILNWAYGLYTSALPAGLWIAMTARLLREVSASSLPPAFTTMANFSIYLLASITIVLYLSFVHFRR